MAKITFKGAPVNTAGNLPSPGTLAPEFKLTKTDLSDVTLKEFLGKKVILNIFPSLDTSVCAASVRKFNAEAAKLPDTVVLTISKDLPFAHSRFCSVEGLTNVIPLSELRDDNFSKNYGVKITEGPLAGVFSRAVVVIDKNGKVVYTEQVPEIANEPNYEAAIETAKNS